ncbi:hypothetical protein [Plasmodium yoelii yoelii]|uniref:Uncharacterized protein n=1 Tax=Plasmodium yoelii yoelii TaxID=73239 RepID=Q7RBP8_PLAYO|nr:hypothetical protein [Plasmodium yoelii yoelii]
MKILNVYIFAKIYDNTKEIYQKNKHLLYIDTEETIKACKFMNDALKQLEHHATSKGYTICGGIPSENKVFYKKKHRGHTKILKAEYLIYDPNQVSINEQHKKKNCPCVQSKFSNDTTTLQKTPVVSS